MIHYARSAFFVARYHLLQGGNDIALAKEYLTIVARSNSEEVGAARELLKKVDDLLADATREVAQPSSTQPSILSDN